MICTKAEILVYLQKANSTLSAADDAIIDLVHPLAESVVSRYLQTDLGYRLTVEYHPAAALQPEREYPLEDIRRVGDNLGWPGEVGTSDVIILRNTPVALTSLEVWEDSNAMGGQAEEPWPAATKLVLGTDYYLDVDGSSGLSSTGILRHRGYWSSVPRSIKVSYYGGPTAAQLNSNMSGGLKLATLKTIKRAYYGAKTAEDQVKTREKIGQYEIENDPKLMNLLFGPSSTIPADAIQDLQPYRVYRYR